MSCLSRKETQPLERGHNRAKRWRVTGCGREIFFVGLGSKLGGFFLFSFLAFEKEGGLGDEEIGIKEIPQREHR